MKCRPIEATNAGGKTIDDVHARVLDLVLVEPRERLTAGAARRVVKDRDHQQVFVAPIRLGVPLFSAPYGYAMANW